MSQNDLVVKMIYKHFDNGNILSGRYAIDLGDDTYQIFRKDNTTMEVKIGQIIPNAGEAALDHNGNIRFGQNTILVGKQPHEDFYLTQTVSKNKFNLNVRDESGQISEIREVLVDSHIEELDGVLTRNPDGRLYVNERNIPLFVKEYEKILMAFNQDRSGGKFGYFNTSVPNDPNNKKNGIPGVITPGRNGKPTTFSEEGPDGTLYITAFFKPNEDGRTVTGRLRSLDAAVEDRMILVEMKKIKETEADPYGEDPNDIQDYAILKAKLESLRASSSVDLEFGVLKGHRLLGLKQNRAAQPSSPAP